MCPVEIDVPLIVDAGQVMNWVGALKGDIGNCFTLCFNSDL